MNHTKAAPEAVKQEAELNMTRKEWRNLVEDDLGAICQDKGHVLNWTASASPAAMIVSNGRKTHLAPNGMWFLGSEGKAIEDMIPRIEDEDGDFRSEPCLLGKVEAYRQPSGRLAIVCELPTEKERLEGIVVAVAAMQNQIASLGKQSGPMGIPARKLKRPKSSFKERCELVVVLAEAIVANGLESRVPPQLAGRVFGIADHAPIVGESCAYREERQSSTDSKSRLEHVVPCKVVVQDVLLNWEFHKTLSKEKRVSALMQLLQIVKISENEQVALDRKLRLKDCMPEGWRWDADCIFARLKRAAIEWKLFCEDSEPCQCSDCKP